METGARIFATLGMVVLVIVILVADADARGHTGSLEWAATTATAKEAITLEGTRSPVIPSVS